LIAINAIKERYAEIINNNLRSSPELNGSQCKGFACLTIASMILIAAS
jgi:hypothetical protein